jgi:glycosyltransferase involved in cell wall biosynthesis
MPKISVLMAVFDTDFILVKRAIDSVLNQDFQDFEFIIIDDGSQNGCHHRILDYVIQYEAQISYLRHSNCGQSESINKGILYSSGEFITILDSDDEYKPNHLSSCLQEITKLGLDLIASTTETIVNSKEDFYVPDKLNNSEMVHVDDCILFATLFGKKEVFLDNKFLKKYAADAHFYAIASEKYAVKKVDLRTYIYYRNIPNSTTAKIKKATIHSIPNTNSNGPIRFT